MENVLKDTELISSEFYTLKSLTKHPEMLMSTLRLQFKNTYWMECNDPYMEGERMVVIAAEPIAGIEINSKTSGVNFKCEHQQPFSFHSQNELWEYLDNWIEEIKPAKNNNCSYNGVLGYCSYNAVQLSEKINFSNYAASHPDEIPLMKFNLYRYLFVFKKGTKETILINNYPSYEANELSTMKSWLSTTTPTHITKFHIAPEIHIDCTDSNFIENVKQAKLYCLKGDIFQVVLSRKFSRKFKGDPWAFFLELKQNNSSPYQFFIDERNFQITGTSPEIHFSATNKVGCINPIAGTYKRSDFPEEEQELERKLLNDPKENAEHTMLVDLARNDLNKIAANVHVSQFKAIEKYTHVMHIVSKVKGKLHTPYNPFQLIMEVFPAGTLSGAPKYRAMEIIDELESSSRSFYGGALGWIGFNKDINTCIIIRSALFKNNIITYRAGAGIVESSVPELEFEEINNKLKSITVVLEKFQH